MDVPRNAFKAALREGRRQIGVWSSISDPGVMELVAGCGYDWILIDTEHTGIDIATTQMLMQAAAAYPVTTIVRPGWNDAVEIKRLLDAGAQTLLIPYVQNAQEAEAAVAAMRYPKRGIRGVAGLTRATRFGAIPNYVERAGEELCLLVQVETAAALEEIENIAAVDGVDGIFIGPADLAASMGYHGDPSHLQVRTAILDAVARIRAAGQPAGFLALDQAMIREVAKAGGQFLAVEVDVAALRQALILRRQEWR